MRFSVQSTSKGPQSPTHNEARSRPPPPPLCLPPRGERMFKRNVTVTGQHQLSGKDGKKLCREIGSRFPALEKEVKTIIPPKTEVLVQKISNKCLVYSVGGTPVFFECEGELYPTVYTLWRYPDLLPALYTHSEVSPKIVGGADLMLPGVIVPDSGLGDFEVGDPSVVLIPENPFPFAVGFMQTGSEAIKSDGLKGRGVKVLHHYPDALWAMGTKATPNAGFKPNRIHPVRAEDDRGDDEGGRAGAGGKAEIAEKMAGASLESTGGGGGGAGVSMDELVDATFLRALHLKVKDDQLPMEASAFYSNCMLPSRPPGTEIDMKKTSYKKLSKLIKKMEKRGLITAKQSKKDDRITGVNRTHEVYLLFGEELAVEGEGQQTGGAPAAIAVDASGSPGGAARAGAKEIEVFQVFRATSNLRPIFGDNDKDAVFTEDEIKRTLVAYAAREALTTSDSNSANPTDAVSSQTLSLDKLLKSGLYGKKEEVEVGSVVPLCDVYTRLVSKMQTYHKVVCDGDEVVKKGKIKHIHVTTEDRHAGRKWITKVSQLESFGIDPQDFGTTLQRKYKCSSTCTKLPGKHETGKEVSFQGNLMDDICEYLEVECGIRPQFIDKGRRGR